MISAAKSRVAFLHTPEHCFLKELECGVGQSCSGYFFEVHTDIVGNPRVPLRVLIELFFAPVAAEMEFLVLMGAGEFRIVFINDCQTDGIGCHNDVPRNSILGSGFCL
jgi:hypothetical protein